ncbi:hypothetical protein [Corallincola spongiicola]|uniref:Uncharacterized protein n=1 Tax=Corallincola spongiicola TaxID=2520508 RepID=A0ABY1WTU1_9GAMM|nr:hypothetical protein [Corallincola spongiicola]TAA47991.1 hypothetical protein EXY25_01730 [Corallincola spongiicola]
MSGYKKTLSPYQKRKYKMALIGAVVAFLAFIIALQGIATLGAGFVSLYGILMCLYNLLLGKFNYDEVDSDIDNSHESAAKTVTNASNKDRQR